MKEHKSHDIVLLCPVCHQQSSLYDADLRERLAVECDAPVSHASGAKYTCDHDLQQISSAAK